MTYWAVYTTATGALLDIVCCDTHPRFNGYPWDGTTMMSTNIGDAMPDFAVKAWDPAGKAVVDDLAALRNVKWNAIKDQRESRRVVISTTFGEFDADETAKSNLLGRLAAFNIAGGDPVMWKLHDNSFVTLSQADFTSAALQVMAGVEAVYAASFALEEQLRVAATAAEIAAVDPMQGWPAQEQEAP